MSGNETNQPIEQSSKKRFWQDWRVWAVVCLLLVACTVIGNGGTDTTKESIPSANVQPIPTVKDETTDQSTSESGEQEFIEESREVFQAINLAFESKTMPEKQWSKWIADHERNREKNPTKYSEKEKYILDGLRGFLVNTGGYSNSSDETLENEILNKRSELAKVLNMEEAVAEKDNTSQGKGISEEFYKNAQRAFQEIDLAYETKKGNPNNSEGIKWVAEENVKIDKNQSSYSEKEKEVIKELAYMIAALSSILFDENGMETLSAEERKNVEQNYLTLHSMVAKELKFTDLPVQPPKPLSKPEEIREEIYTKSLETFHELNNAYIIGYTPKEEVISWPFPIWEVIEKDLGTDQYTSSEKEVIQILVYLANNIQNFQKSRDPQIDKMINYGRTRLSELLTVEVTY